MTTPRTFLSRVGLSALCLIAAAALWLPVLSGFFRPTEPVTPQSAVARGLLARHLVLWEDGERRREELARMRGANAEWDFMGRTFLVLALANLVLEEPAEEERYLAVIDRVIEDTLDVERERGMEHFLMDYWRAGSFVEQPPRSVFVDGEIALMLAARERVAPTLRWQAALADRVELVVRRMSAGPVLSAESYPDECWTFCNTLALAAVRISDSATGDDHSAFLHAWVERARARLIDTDTGMLVSSYTHDGRFLDGPEGSSIFLAAHALELIDPAFARDQYARARRELGRELLGFGWATEWPAYWHSSPDVDSGPVIPIVEASAGASGMAVLGASAFRDQAWLGSLRASLALAAFPVADGPALRYAASNQVGDAVLLYAYAEGPLWEAVGPAPRPATPPMRAASDEGAGGAS